MAEDTPGGGKPAGGKGTGPLTRKVAGQPAWIWIVAVVVFAIGVQWYRQRAAAAAAAAQVATASTLAQDPATKGTGVLPAGPSAVASNAGPTLTTDQWLSQAMAAARNAGEDPIHAARALNAFLNGGNLSYADTLVVNAAVDAIGTPVGFTNVPPGSWASRTLPTATPAGPSETVTSLIAQPNNPGVFAYYSDGAIRAFNNAGEFASFISARPDLQYASGAAKITVLQANDPIWSNTAIDYGAQGKTGYDKAKLAYQHGDPNWTPYWAQPAWVAQQQAKVPGA